MIVNTTVGSVKLKIDTKEIDKNFNKAQVYLDNRVLMDSSAHTPKQTNVLRASGIKHTRLGSGTVCWNTPYAHYQYEGRAMVGKQSRRAWARKGEPKVYNGKHLTYSQPSARAKWFEVAKKKFLDSWIKGVKKIIGGS